MRFVCSVCHVELRPETPGNRDSVSHGLCRKDELRALSQAKVITTQELMELAEIEWKERRG